MHPLSSQALRNLFLLATLYILMFAVLMFLGVLLFDFNAVKVDAIMDGQAQPVFNDPLPEHFPFYSLVITWVLCGGLFCSVWFERLRVITFVPETAVFARQTLFLIQNAQFTTTILAVTFLHYAALLAQSDAEIEQSIRLVVLQFYLHLAFGGLEHLLVMRVLWSDARLPAWLKWATLIPTVIGLIANFAVLNPELPPIRIIGGTIMGAEIVFWMFYLFFAWQQSRTAQTIQAEATTLLNR